MNIKNEMILQDYIDNYENYEIISRVLKEQLLKYVKDFNIIVNSVEVRIKTKESLTGKLELKGDKYNSILDITDIVGGRVVTFYSDEVDKFAASIEANFDIDWDNSIDKRKMLDSNEFGYLSLHYVCRLPKSLYYNEAHPEINDIRFEIQLKSVLQHAWASINHDTGYKNDIEIPKEYRRSLSRLAGLLELADESFCQIRNSLVEYRKHIKGIVKSGNLAEVELNIDSFNAFVENGAFNRLNKRIATINNMDIEEVSLRNFLTVFKALGIANLEQLNNFIIKYSDSAYEFAIRQFNGKDIDIISNATAPLYLCLVYVISNNLGEPIVKMLLDAVFGPGKNNQQLAKRFLQVGISMGLTGRGDDSNEQE